MKKRTFLHSVLLAYGLLLGCSSRVGASAHGVGENKAVSDSSTHFPAGTVFLARQQQTGTLLWATMQTLHNSRTGATFAFLKSGFVCKRIVWSADRKRLLVQGQEAASDWDSLVTDSYILDASSLRLVRHIKTPVAWLQDVGYAYLDEEANPPRILSSAGKSTLLPFGFYILAADFHTGYLLGATPLPCKRHEEEVWGPAYLLQLWKQTARGGLRRIRTICKTHFDPGSSGIPRVFGMAGKRRVLIGEPHGGADETLQVAEGGHITLPFPHTEQFTLKNVYGPLAAENTIFGLAEPLRQGDQPRRRKFLYQVTDKKVTLQEVDMDVVFVYYDPVRRSIGLGSATPSGVVVRYIVVKNTTK